jgi:hypothetical protein
MNKMQHIYTVTGACIKGNGGGYQDYLGNKSSPLQVIKSQRARQAGEAGVTAASLRTNQ